MAPDCPDADETIRLSNVVQSVWEHRAHGNAETHATPAAWLIEIIYLGTGRALVNIAAPGTHTMWTAKDPVRALIAEKRIGIIRLFERLERLFDDILFTRPRPQPGQAIDRNQLDSRRNAERYRVAAGQSHLHETREYRGGNLSAGRRFAHGLWRIVANVDTDDHIRRIPDEPGILRVIGGPGLAGQRHSRKGTFDDGRRTTVDDPLQDRRHLIGRMRIDDLAPVISNLRLRLVLPCLRVAF